MTTESRVTIAGFGIAATFGQAGGMVGPGAAQNLCWGVSSIGLVVGSFLFAILQLRRRHDVVATGFATLALGEGLMWAGGNPSEPGQTAAFAAGVLFYVPALLLISVPRALPTIARVLGATAAVVWSVYAFLYLTQRTPSPSSGVAIAGYVALSAACIAWAVVAWRERSAFEIAKHAITNERDRGAPVREQRVVEALE